MTKHHTHPDLPIRFKMSAFNHAIEQFKVHGDFLILTQQFPLSIPTPINFSLPSCHITLLDSGILFIEPKTPKRYNETSTDLIISSGIHGNETAPIEIVNQLVKNIIKAEITVKIRLLMIIGNPVAMNKHQRFSDENLNVLFTPLSKNKRPAITASYEQERAEKLMRCVARFYHYPIKATDEMTGNVTGNATVNNIKSITENKQNTRLHYDLHTAIRPSTFEKFAIYPFQENKCFDKQQLVFLQQCGVNTILLSHAPSATFAAFSNNHHNAHAFTLELGKVRPFGENNMNNFHEIKQKLHELISRTAITFPTFNHKNFHLFQVVASIKKTSEHFILQVDDNVANFTHYKKGTILAEDISPTPTQAIDNNQSLNEQALTPCYVTQHPAEYIVFPNKKVAIGERLALMVIPTTL